MKILRIANIIGHADDRQAASRHSYEIPVDAVSPGFEIGYVALARPQTMLNDLDRMVTELAYVEAGLRAQAEGFDAIMIGPEIGRASCRERVCSTCRSRWSPYHYKTTNNQHKNNKTE